MVQHHAARRTHYDFRLEWEGVLKSWAVPKGPSPNPADKRLAVRTEDHPLDYADFEGKIPSGNYGAGSVIVWDQGTWVPLNDIDAGFDQGKLLFQLKGFKLHGKWTLVKIKKSTKEWLLIKESDGFVNEAGTDAYSGDSVFSGLSVEELAGELDCNDTIGAELHSLGVTAKEPPWPITPMLAKPGKPFDKPGWGFEIKYDGYRIIARKNGTDAHLLSRNGHDLTPVFPEISDALSRLPYRDLIIDGEAVVHDENGLPSFARLQKRGRLTKPRDIQRASRTLPATLYTFDALAVNGHDLRQLPLTERKRLLKALLPSAGVLRYSEHIERSGLQMFEHVLHLGLEGMVAKDLGSKYNSGRSESWVKVSGEHNDDFVVVGFTRSDSGDRVFGALLLAQYVDGELVYSGRVGSGFNQKTMAEIRARLERIPTAKPPPRAPVVKDASWLEPSCVAQIKYKNITPDGLLRAPVFMSLREDKSPSECQREYQTHELPVPEVEPERARNSPSVTLTNLDKLFWPGENITKGDLIKHYDQAAEWMLPYLAERPVVLTRYPDGIEGKSFYQKDAPAHTPDWLRTEKLWSEQAQREIAYFVIDSREALKYIANMGSIPIHMWSSRAGSLERPDWCILDLDPKQAGFDQVLSIARHIHNLCTEIELSHYVKTSGSTGLHILIPLGAQYTYEQSRMLGELLARITVRDLPEIATVVRSPGKRGEKVYVDYLQNRHGQTIVAPFSVRPLAGAPVSMPFRWRELSRISNPKFTLRNWRSRVKRWAGDPMTPVLDEGTDLSKTLTRLSQML